MVEEHKLKGFLLHMQIYENCKYGLLMALYVTLQGFLYGLGSMNALSKSGATHAKGMPGNEFHHTTSTGQL